MPSRIHVSKIAIEHLKRFEGFRAQAARLADGRWTIGYGHTKSAREGAEIGEKDAEALLIYDLMAVEKALNDQVFTPLNQNQTDALAAFVFNIGDEAFQDSAVLRRINEGALLQAASEMELWRSAEVGGDPLVVDALVRRRALESALFLTPPDGFAPAPTPVVRPRLDEDRLGVVPRTAPLPVNAALDGEWATAEVEHPLTKIVDPSVEPPLTVQTPASRPLRTEEDLAWLNRIARAVQPETAQKDAPLKLPVRLLLFGGVGLLLFLAAIFYAPQAPDGAAAAARGIFGLIGLIMACVAVFRLLDGQARD